MMTKTNSLGLAKGDKVTVVRPDRMVPKGTECEVVHVTRGLNKVIVKWWYETSARMDQAEIDGRKLKRV